MSAIYDSISWDWYYYPEPQTGDKMRQRDAARSKRSDSSERGQVELLV